MRMLLRVTIPVEKGNQAVQDGTLQRVLEGAMNKIRPEAAYFSTMGTGKRASFFVFDMADPSQIPAITEPILQGLDAEVEFCPVMNLDDLMRGLQGLG
ncbi:MAG TPA: hypothetical protein VMU89_01475 [Thermomicrobiaceae bacterium]|nr:hypothetical protein [Thermomicrobiaceae bacterium]